MVFLCWGTAAQSMLDRIGKKLPADWRLTTDSSDLPEARAILVLNRKLDAGHLQQAGQLRFVQITRMDHDLVDLDAAGAVGIPVVCRPIAHWTGVAEHTMLLVLALAKRLLDADRAVRDRAAYPVKECAAEGLPFSFAYNWPHLGGLVSLSRSTLGLVGMGHIGVEVARRARAFGLEILYWQRSRLPLYYEAHLGVAYRSLPQLLGQSDFVSLHLALTPDTRHLIGEDQFRLMKPTAFLINTARGDVVDEAALVRALEDRTIAGAGLDVFTKEPLPEDCRLVRLSNVILTPHYASGYDTFEQSQDYIADQWTSTARDLADGKDLAHIINGCRGTGDRAKRP